MRIGALEIIIKTCPRFAERGSGTCGVEMMAD